MKCIHTNIPAYYYEGRTVDLLFKILLYSKIINLNVFFLNKWFLPCIMYTRYIISRYKVYLYKVSFLNGTLIVVKIILKVIITRVINLVFTFFYCLYIIFNELLLLYNLVWQRFSTYGTCTTRGTRKGRMLYAKKISLYKIMDRIII